MKNGSEKLYLRKGGDGDDSRTKMPVWTDSKKQWFDGAEYGKIQADEVVRREERERGE